MASARYGAMSSRPSTSLKTESFDMDSLFDFNAGTTQASASSSQIDTLSPFDRSEERQRFNGPSHDYHQYKQQVGLLVGSMANLPPMSQPPMFDGYSSGLGDMGMDGFGAGWSSGIDVDLDADMNMDFNNPASAMPAMFFPPPTNDAAADTFINPTTIAGQDEPPSSVGRLWPGMHSEQARQAAMQKSQQSQAMQQRQLKMQAQQAAYRQSSVASQHSQAPSQASSSSNGKRVSHHAAAEPHVEESISRLLHQMRQQSHMGDDDDSGDMLPHIARMKKDEEEMDDDERLLNSDEGKKLSSKERRQLRNKVSARAFRSRRKEYIGQLEGEVALKVQESTGLRQENTALLQENERYRGLIETLLRHPAFTPFINDLSQDPAVLGMPARQTRHLQAPAQIQQQGPGPQQASATPVQQQVQPQQQQQQQLQQQDVKPEYLNFDASQLELPAPPQQQQQVGLAMIPEENFSKLNLGGFPRGVNFGGGGGGGYGVNAYAVTGVPRGPDPVGLLAVGMDARVPTTACATGPHADSTVDFSVLLAKLDGAAARLGALGS
ncbi:hypothetical protein LTR53_002527 [Teratosphaeriaceae sp. CCFEE 6253]|nr:hypothetical protein LTR53_002527 [Teratosphaeriaceae sp. CCFEE 6253]